ncbi:MAG TPA: alpha/beta hydrolase [Planktothrix sp. UBA10369]|nr:alpha/beta hydrolase [Planktothrix sp. UBA10369]
MGTNKYYLLPIPHSPFPIPHYLLPLTYYPLPIPHSLLPIIRFFPIHKLRFSRLRLCE